MCQPLRSHLLLPRKRQIEPHVPAPPPKLPRHATSHLPRLLRHLVVPPPHKKPQPPRRPRRRLRNVVEPPIPPSGLKPPLSPPVRTPSPRASILSAAAAATAPPPPSDPLPKLLAPPLAALPAPFVRIDDDPPVDNVLDFTQMADISAFRHRPYYSR